MRRILLAFALLLAPVAAEAATCTVNGNYTWTSATQDVSDCGSESASDTYLIPASTSLTIPAGTTITVAKVKVTGGTMTVAGKLAMTGCNDGQARTYGAAPCGATSGTFAATGSVLHDSATHGAIWTKMTQYTVSGRIMRLNFNATPNGGNFAAGDILWIESGPAMDHAYLVSAVNTAGCATATEATCYIDIELYKSTAAFGTSAYPDTANLARNAAYLDLSGAPTAPVFNDARIAQPPNANFLTNALDRKVIGCSSGSGTCVASALLAKSGAYTGWYFAATQTTVSSGYTAADLVTRTLIVNSENDISTPISGDTGTVDVLTLADPIATEDYLVTGALSTSVRALNGLIWPGFWNADDWKLIRPAKVFYTGADGDGNFGVYGPDACLDADYAHFNDWAAVVLRGGLSSTTAQTTCTSPLSYVLVQESGGGDGVNLTDSGIFVGCDLHAITVGDFAEFNADHLAITDHRTPADTTSTCCVVGGSGASCAGGAAGLVTAGDGEETDSATHGISLGNIIETNLSHYFNRYIGDAAIAFTNDDATLPAEGTRINVNGITCWWIAQGDTAECIVTSSTNVPVAVTVTDAVAYNGNASEENGCNYGVFSVNQLAGETISIDRAVIIDTINSAPAVFQIDGSTGGYLRNAFVYARDQDGGTSPRSCSLTQNVNLENVWADGYAAASRLYAPEYIRRVYWRSENSSAPTSQLLGMQASYTHEVSNSIFENMSTYGLLTPAANGATLDIRNNYFGWAAFLALNAFGSFGNGYTALAALSGNIIDNATMLNCSGATWGAANGPKIADNLVSSVGGSANPSITSLANCAGAGDLYHWTPDSYARPGLRPHLPSDVGPRGTVGVASRSLLDRLEIRSAYKTTGGGGGSTGWLPRAF